MGHMSTTTWTWGAAHGQERRSCESGAVKDELRKEQRRLLGRDARQVVAVVLVSNWRL